MHNPFKIAVRIFQLSCKTKFKYTNIISEVLENLDASVSMHEADTTTNIDPMPDDNWHVDAYFNDFLPKNLDDIIKNLQSKVEIFDVVISEVDDKDWVSEVQKNIPIISIPPFIISDPVKLKDYKGQNVIAIEAGRAFGTGTHETTALCVEGIVELSKKYELKRILDLGTGSGILAIAASRLTNARIFASDIDKVAVDVARRNLKINNIKNVKTYISNGINNRIMFQDPFNLVIANILAKPLIDMARDISRIVDQGGFVMLSGFLKNQQDSVEIEYQKRKFKTLCIKHKGDWVRLIMQKL